MYHFYPRYYQKDKNDRKSLLTHLPRAKREGYLFSREVSKYREFCYADKLTSFFRYYINLPLPDRVHYEVIRGDFAQKPHFDIDISDGKIDEEESLHLIDQILQACQNILKEEDFSLTPDQVFLTTSHGPSKISYHLVLLGIAHSNHQDSRAFAEEVQSHIDEKYRDYVDMAVYSSLQNFRLLGSSKVGKRRTKRLADCVPWHGEKRENTYSFEGNFRDRYEIFCRSLVSYVEDCRILFSRQRVDKNVYESATIDQDDVKRALDIFSNYLGVPLSHSPYRYTGMKGSLVILRRVRPSFCDICQRKHDNDNPYLLIHHNQIYYNCRRSKERILLGTLIDETEEIRNDHGEICQLAFA